MTYALVAALEKKYRCPVIIDTDTDLEDTAVSVYIIVQDQEYLVEQWFR